MQQPWQQGSQHACRLLRSSVRSVHWRHLLPAAEPCAPGAFTVARQMWLGDSKPQLGTPHMPFVQFGIHDTRC